MIADRLVARTSWRLLVAFALLASPALLAGQARPSADADLERLAAWMVGAYSSAAQAKADPAYREVELRMIAIWPERSDGPWLYVEQAMAESRDRPYRQRVYRLQRGADGRLASRVYTLPGDPLRYAGAWRERAPLAKLRPRKLAEKVGCAVYLAPSADGQEFRGATEGAGCASDLRGASYATSEVTVTADSMASWDRGFDASKRQVWGAEKGPYLFLRIPFNPPRTP